MMTMIKHTDKVSLHVNSLRELPKNGRTLAGQLAEMASPPNAPRGHQPINYSRFDHIGSDDEDDDPDTPRVRSRPQPPPDVRDDLEDYFRRMDERRAASDGAESSEPASVDRFTDEQIARLETLKYVSTDTAAASSAGSECAICLNDFAVGEELTTLPCAASHAFHTECVKNALSRSVHCPLCRVDVRALMPVAGAAEQHEEDARSLTPRQLGFTRDGGIIQRYEPHPPADLPRPAYIPAHQADQAELVEIMYPNAGMARVWRLPRALFEENE